MITIRTTKTERQYLRRLLKSIKRSQLVKMSVHYAPYARFDEAGYRFVRALLAHHDDPIADSLLNKLVWAK